MIFGIAELMVGSACRDVVLSNNVRSNCEEGGFATSVWVCNCEECGVVIVTGFATASSSLDCFKIQRKCRFYMVNFGRELLQEGLFEVRHL